MVFLTGCWHVTPLDDAASQGFKLREVVLQVVGQPVYFVTATKISHICTGLLIILEVENTTFGLHRLSSQWIRELNEVIRFEMFLF